MTIESIYFPGVVNFKFMNGSQAGKVEQLWILQNQVQSIVDRVEMIGKQNVVTEVEVFYEKESIQVMKDIFQSVFPKAEFIEDEMIRMRLTDADEIGAFLSLV